MLRNCSLDFSPGEFALERDSKIKRIEQYIQAVFDQSNVGYDPQTRVDVHVTTDNHPRDGIFLIPMYTGYCHVFGKFPMGDFSKTPYLTVVSPDNIYANKAMIDALELAYIELVARVMRQRDVTPTKIIAEVGAS